MYEDLNPVYPRIKKPPPLVLRVWENDFGVPSVDPECLQLMILFKIHRINFTVSYACCPMWADVPSIQFNEVTVAKGANVIAYATELCKKTVDTTLDSKVKYRIDAYKKYFVECFADVFYFDCWLNNVNYEHAIRTWYENVIPFPFHYFYLKKMRQRAKNRFKNVLGSRDADKYIMKQHLVAARCLKDFASLLKDGRMYFFGNLPSSLDIAVYSYLAVALHMPLPDQHLQNLIKNHPELVRYVKNMTQRYFPDTASTFKYVEPVGIDTDCASTKSLVIAGLCATVAMVIYACSIGLLGKLHLGTD